MSDVVAQTKSALVIVHQAVRALETGNVSRGYKLFGDVKKSGITIIKETEYLLKRVSAVEKYYREQENAKAREIGELYGQEQAIKQMKEEKRHTIMSKEADILQAKRDLGSARRDLSSAEDDRRRARKRKDAAESSKNVNIAGAVGFGIATVLTLGLASPITVPGAVICTANALEASDDEDRAERDVKRCSNRINQCTRNISQLDCEVAALSRHIRQLDSEIADLSHKISALKSQRDRIHAQTGEIQGSIRYLRDVLKFWREFSQLTERGTERATLLQKLSAILKIHNRHTSGLSRQLQSCASAWEDVETKLERGAEHLFLIDFTCHYCRGALHDLPHLSYGKFCCTGCYTIGRWQWILSDAPSVSDALKLFPSMRKTRYLERELMMITDLDNPCEHVDDKLAYFSIRIQALAKEEAKHSPKMKELLQSHMQELEGVDDEFKNLVEVVHLLEVLTFLVCPRSKARLVYRFLMENNLNDEVFALAANHPYIALVSGGSSAQVFFVVERCILEEVMAVSSTLVGLIAVYVSFNMEYPKSIYLVLIFIQHFVLLIRDKQTVPHSITKLLSSLDNLDIEQS